MFVQLPWELQHIILRYLDISTLTQARHIDANYEAKVKQILLAYHNPLEVMLSLVPEPQDMDAMTFTICNSSAITLDFIQSHPDLIDYETLSSNLALTPDIIDTYAHRLTWSDKDAGLSINPALTGQGLHPQSIEDVIALLRRHHQRIDWVQFNMYQKLTLSLIEGIADYIIWDRLFISKHLTDDIIEKYIDRLNLDILLLRNRLSKEFIITHHHRITIWIDATTKCLEKWPELIIEYPDWPWTW